jgi:hypothetical protein
MKVEEVFKRVARDPELGERLRAMAYEARDGGMKSAAYTRLVKELGLAETPSDLKALKSTMGYLMVLNGVLSKVPFLCLLPHPVDPTVGYPSQRAAAAKPAVAPTSRRRAAAKRSKTT